MFETTLNDSLRSYLSGEFYWNIMYQRTTFVSHTFNPKPHEYLDRVSRLVFWNRTQRYVTDAYDGLV